MNSWGVTGWDRVRAPQFMLGAALVGTLVIVGLVVVFLISGAGRGGCGSGAVSAALSRGPHKVSCPPDGADPVISAEDAEAAVRHRWGDVHIGASSLLIVRIGGAPPAKLMWVLLIDSPRQPPPLATVVTGSAVPSSQIRSWIEMVDAETGEVLSEPRNPQP